VTRTASDPCCRLFRDGTFRTDVAAARKVYRLYRGRQSWFPICFSLERTAPDTNDTKAARRRYIADTGYP